MTGAGDESMGQRRRQGRSVLAGQLSLSEEEAFQYVVSRFGRRFADELLVALGGAWSDDLPLSRRDRSLIVLTVLATQGGSEARMRLHVRWAIDHGLNREELEALGMVLAVYAGYPRASVALETIRSELDVLG